MGCCGSKKKKDDVSNEPSEPPPPPEPKKEEITPEPAPARPSEQTLENQYKFQAPEEKPDEDAGPRKDTLEQAPVEIQEPSVSVQENVTDEQCTPLQNPSPVVGKGELEPIEPVKIPLTSHVDSMGPGDKNNLIVRAPMLSANEASPSPNASSNLSPQSKTGPNATTTDSYYTETGTTEGEGETTTEEE